MSDAAYPPEPLQRRVFRWIEDQIIGRSASLVCTTPGAIAAYARRYPHAAPERFCLIENGYDEEAFTDVQPNRFDTPQDTLLLLHSGLIYPQDRNPSTFFAAIKSGAEVSNPIENECNS